MKWYLQEILSDFHENSNKPSLGASESLLEVSRWVIFAGFLANFWKYKSPIIEIAKNPKQSFLTLVSEKCFRTA